MKKIKYILFLLLLTIFIGINKVSAFSINANTTVYVGNSVKVTVEASGLTGRFDITSSNGNVLAGGDSKWLENSSVDVYFTANQVGSATIIVNATNVSDANGDDFTGSRSITINVIKKNTTTPIEINKTYSSNNNLKSLSIDGYELNPAFNKDTLEYTIELTPGTEKINVKAVAEHNNATIKGVGEVQVSEGANTINIVVTAENGNEKTYKIKANMEEKDPIEVEINGKKYRVIKKRELIGAKDGYKEDTVKISDFDIPALYNEVTKITLVGLKNSDGDIGLYAYDSKTGKYSIYKEYEFNRMNLYIHEDKKSSYTKKKIKINGEEVTAYKVEDLDDYYLIYATNTMTGHEGYYLYDVEENSVQRYNTYMLDKLMKEKDKYLSIVLVLSCVCFLAMLFLLIEVNKIKKMKI